MQQTETQFCSDFKRLTYWWFLKFSMSQWIIVHFSKLEAATTVRSKTLAALHEKLK